MEISLEALRIFYYVAKFGNITKASEYLYISQPAVSISLKNLEQSLGVTLFLRNKKGVILTQIGQKIYDAAKDACGGLKKIKNIVEEENSLVSGEISIGTSVNIAKKFLTKPLKTFLEKYPLVTISLIKDMQDNMVRKLKNGEIDMIFTQQIEIDEDFGFLPLCTQSYVFVKSPELKQERFIKFGHGSYSTKMLEKFLAENNIQDCPYIVSFGNELAIDFALNGLGIAFLPKFIVEDELKEGKLVQIYQDYSLPTAKFGIYFNKNNMTTASKELLNIIKNHLDKR